MLDTHVIIVGFTLSEKKTFSGYSSSVVDLTKSIQLNHHLNLQMYKSDETQLAESNLHVQRLLQAQAFNDASLIAIFTSFQL